MLVNPFRRTLDVLPHTRILQDTFGVLQERVVDPLAPSRLWRVESLFQPLPRAIGGIRVKVCDQKGFISFINQRDFEVLTGRAQPGDYGQWFDGEYVEPGHPDWVGFFADDADLDDDLCDRELLLRGDSPNGVLTPPLEITRRVHREPGVDYEELLLLQWDYDPVTGIQPDPRVSTIQNRWIRAELTRTPWNRTAALS